MAAGGVLEGDDAKQVRTLFKIETEHCSIRNRDVSIPGGGTRGSRGHP